MACAAVLAALLAAPTLRWEHRHEPAALESAVEISFDDPEPLYGPEIPAPDGRDRVLGSRAAVARRLGALLLSLTATLSTNLRYGMEADFGYSLAAAWVSGPVSFGVAMLGGLGDPQVLLEPPCRDHFFASDVSWSFAPGWIARAQLASRLSPGGDMARLQIAYLF